MGTNWFWRSVQVIHSYSLYLFVNLKSMNATNFWRVSPTPNTSSFTQVQLGTVTPKSFPRSHTRPPGRTMRKWIRQQLLEVEMICPSFSMSSNGRFLRWVGKLLLIYYVHSFWKVFTAGWNLTLQAISCHKHPFWQNVYTTEEKASCKLLQITQRIPFVEEHLWNSTTKLPANCWSCHPTHPASTCEFHWMSKRIRNFRKMRDR